MAEVCSHPKGALIVPSKVIPAFQGSLLPRDESSTVDSPKTFGGKIAKLIRKSSLVTAPSLIVGSISGLTLAVSAIPNPSIPLAMAITVSSLIGISTGALGTVSGMKSLLDGDREYAPLPPTKEYLALQESKKEAVIAPFQDWDDMFRKNDARVQKMISDNK